MLYISGVQSKPTSSTKQRLHLPVPRPRSMRPTAARTYSKMLTVSSEISSQLPTSKTRSCVKLIPTCVSHMLASDMLQEARNSSSRVVSTVEAHLGESQHLQESHSSHTAGINTHADNAFQSSYKVSETSTLKIL